MTQRTLAETIPLQPRDDGTIRVAGTRVTLDTVVAAFRAGATPEEIVLDYPSLRLGDVYAVIAYYLRHEGDVQHYLQERSSVAASVRQENETRLATRDLRSRLVARQRP